MSQMTASSIVAVRKGQASRRLWPLAGLVLVALGSAIALFVIGDKDSFWRLALLLLQGAAILTLGALAARAFRLPASIPPSAPIGERQQLIDGIEGLTDGFALFDADDRLVVCNERYRRLSGDDAGIVKAGARFEDIIRAHVKAKREPTAIGREEEWIAQRLKQHRDPQGSFERLIGGHWYRFSDRPTSDGGIVTMFAQIDELKQREQRLRENQVILQSILDNIPATVSIADRDRRIVLLNRRLEALYGVKLKHVIGRPLAEVRPQRFATDAAAQDHETVIQTGIPIYSREDHYTSDLGEETWLTSVVPIKDDEGVVKLVLRTTIEVPQLTKAYRELADYRAFLIEAERQARIASWYQNAEMDDRVFWSENVEAVIGYRPDQVATDDALVAVVHPADRERIAKLFKEVGDRPRSYECEYRIIRPDESMVWIRSITNVELDSDGRLARFIGTLQDVTLQKSAEEALRESQEFLLTAERRARIACWTQTIGETGGFVDRDLAAYVLGIPRDQMPRNDAEYVQMIHPDDRERAVAAYRRADQQHLPYSVEYRLVRPDGSIGWIRDLAEFQTDPDGKTSRMIGTVQDVTEQKRVDDALRDSEARLRAFMDNAPVFISVKDRDRRFTMINRKVSDALQVPAEDIMGKTIAEILPVAGTQSIMDMEREVIETRKTVSREIHVPERLSAPWTLEVKFPIMDASGEIFAIGGVAIDVSERKKVELALAESEARFRSFMDYAPFDIYVKDLNGRYIMINDSTEISWCRPRAEILGTTVRELSTSAGVEDVEQIEREVLRTGKAVAHEVQFTDLGPEWTHEVKFPIKDAAGKIIHIGAVAVDIGDRKKVELALAESERRLRRAQRQARLAYWSADLAISAIEWSPGSGSIFGVSDAEMPTTEAGYVEFIHPDDRERLQRLYQELRVSLNSYSVEYRLRRPDGAIVWLRELGDVEIDSAGRRGAVHGTLQDITDRRALEEQLQQSQKMEAIGQLTGGIAHDFNNLLAIILGNLDLLNEQKDLGFATRRKIETSIKAGLRAADLTHRLLAFARRQALMPEPTDINDLIRSMAPLLQRPLGPKIAMTFNLSPDTWNADVDASQLEMALLNLTLNARDAMPDGGSLTIATGNATFGAEYAGANPAGDCVSIAITDTGTGMTDDVRSRAFDPFFTTKGVGKGTGLGLSMVYGFVKQSGGHVQIDTREGKGTTVLIHLPRSSGPVHEPEEDEDAPLSAGQRETILLVEDEADVRELAETHLEAFGYCVISAFDGPTALAAVAANPEIDLLLTDIILPGPMDGIAIAAQVRSRRPDIRIVYISGYAPEPDQLLPDTELIRKPFLKADLFRVIREALDGKRPPAT